MPDSPYKPQHDASLSPSNIGLITSFAPPQAVLRCAALRMELVTLRADASIGSDLVELLAGYNSQYDSPAARGRTDPASSPEETHPDCCLLDMLAPAVLQQVLRLEADTQVAAMQNMQEGKFLQIMN